MKEIAPTRTTIAEHELATTLLPKPQMHLAARTAPPKLEGETEEEYVERFAAEYRARVSAAQPPALYERALTAFRALASIAFEPSASADQQAARLAICFACDHFLVSIENPEQIGHCGKCGCSVNKMSSLSVKTTIRHSTCPLKLWDVTINLPDSRLDP